MPILINHLADQVTFQDKAKELTRPINFNKRQISVLPHLRTIMAGHIRPHSMLKELQIMIINIHNMEMETAILELISNLTRKQKHLLKD